MRNQKLSDGFPTDRLVREADQGTIDKSSTFFSHTFVGPRTDWDFCTDDPADEGV